MHMSVCEHACACTLTLSVCMYQCVYVCFRGATSGNNREGDAVTFPLPQAFECVLKETLSSLTVNYRKAI